MFPRGRLHRNLKALHAVDTGSVVCQQVPTKLAISLKLVPTKLAVAVKQLGDGDENKDLIVGDVFPKAALADAAPADGAPAEAAPAAQ